LKPLGPLARASAIRVTVSTPRLARLGSYGNPFGLEQIAKGWRHAPAKRNPRTAVSRARLAGERRPIRQL